MSTKFTGSCLCGAVHYECSTEPAFVGHCHCVDCRKSSGTGHGTHVGMPEQAVRVEGEVKIYDQPADSGNIVSRAFCPNCGSAIYSTNSGVPGITFVRASSLDDPEVITPQMIVYASRAASWDHMDPALPTFAEMPEGGPQQVLAESG